MQRKNELRIEEQNQQLNWTNGEIVSHAVALKYLTTSFICAVYLQDNETPQLQWRLGSFVDETNKSAATIAKRTPQIYFHG